MASLNRAQKELSNDIFNIPNRKYFSLQEGENCVGLKSAEIRALSLKSSWIWMISPPNNGQSYSLLVGF
jgi:hypothetical protein